MITNAIDWAQWIFGLSKLGDVRRERRLIDVASRLARHAGASLAKCCRGNAAAILGSYRLMSNKNVDPDAIAEGGFAAVAEVAQEEGLLVAVEDTTTLSYAHSVADQLGTTGPQRQARQRGYLAHSVLLLAADSERVIGLIEQRIWCRKDEEFGKKHVRRQRPYEDKESYKWQSASQRTKERLGDAMERTISVCDREADVYEYLRYKCDNVQRFVIRAQSDRGLFNDEQTLFASLSGEQEWLYETTIDVAQRGGRSARKARVQVCARPVTLRAPTSRDKQSPPVKVNVVCVRERPRDNETPLVWILLTTEPIDTEEQVREVVRFYKMRWRIEDYHKAWKSGAGVERLRSQSAASLERMVVITAFIAVRIMQLREHALPSRKEKQELPTCDKILKDDEWKVLWLIDQNTSPPPLPPTAKWACLAIAKLGGFADTKRTGRPGWCAMWEGWMVFQEQLKGFRLAKTMTSEM